MFENKDTIVKYLRENTVLRSIDSAEIAKFLDTGGINFFNENEEILTEQDQGSTIYFVINGNIDIIKNEDGKEVYICTLGTGEFFGEAGLFKTMKRTATVKASGDSSILRIDRESFISYLKSSPSSGIKILMLIIYSLLKN